MAWSSEVVVVHYLNYLFLLLCQVLTELGRRQAAATGRRLKELFLPYSVIHYSTMVRATETALIISKSLPGVPTKTTDMLREGAPMEPEPPSTHWRPEHHVRNRSCPVYLQFETQVHHLSDAFYQMLLLLCVCVVVVH